MHNNHASHSIRLSVGYDGTRSSLEHLLSLSECVTNLYTGGPANGIQGGRQQYMHDLCAFEKQAQYASDQGASIHVTLNAPFAPSPSSDKAWWRRFHELLQDLESSGISGVILSHPFLIQSAKNHTGLHITASTIAEISTPQTARYFEQLGADTIVPAVDLNMHPDQLIQIKHALKRANLRLMVNEHCMADCPYRRFHFNSLNDTQACRDFHMNCKKQFFGSPHLILANNIIRPEDILRYSEITNEFKLVGRQLPLEEQAKRVRAYSEQRFNGNYLDLSDDRQLAANIHIPNIHLDSLWKLKTQCDHLCDDCMKCARLFQRFGRFNHTAPAQLSSRAMPGENTQTEG